MSAESGPGHNRHRHNRHQCLHLGPRLFEEQPDQLLQMAQNSEIQVAISDAIRLSPTQVLDVVTDDPDDNRIVECAVASGSDCIVSGDKDLLRMGEYTGINMITVSDFLRRVGR